MPDIDKNAKKTAKPKETVVKDDIYAKMGFMCGLEIHQRLATNEKLFCSCTTKLVDKSEKPIGSVTRYQRAVAGELGSIDKSAEFEGLRNRTFTYNMFENNTCLVDIDEEPPHQLNEEALNIATAMAVALNMNFVDEVQIMRKAVVDGSDPSAFQRTMLISLDGMIEISGCKINIPTLFLEEESSGIQSNSSTNVVYNTDRLGIPLIEIDTDAHIPNPKTAKEIAFYIGTLLRLTGKVQRGIGSIRQDLNMSIKDGARVEIKGVQELDFLDKFIENEVKRQQNLIAIKEKLLKNNAQVGEATNVTPIFINTSVDVIKYHIKDGAVFAFPLKGFKGLLGFEINPNRRLGTEISDYAKMAGVHGIIHSDEDLSKYKFSKTELDNLRKQLKISEEDSFIIVAGKPSEVKRAAELAIGRAKYAMQGVPKETRMAHDNETYTSKFMRPLPTGSRMYPETDIKPVLLIKEVQANAVKNAPNLDKEKKYLKEKIKNAALAEQLLLSPRLQLFKISVERSGADPEFIANVLMQKLTEMKRNGVAVDSITDEWFVDVFTLYAKGTLTKQGVEETLKRVPKESANAALTDIITSNSLSRVKGNDLKALLESLSKGKKMSKEELRNTIMTKYRFNVDGAELNKLLDEKK